MSIGWWARFRSNFGGPLISANLVDMADNSLVETAVTNLRMSILAWNFDDGTAGLNPGVTNLALDNANKDNATAINFNTTSAIDSARFDELLTSLRSGDRIFLHQRNATNTSILYRVTGATTLDGTRVDVPVTRERDQGGEFPDGTLLNVTIFAKGAGDAIDISATEIDATSPATLATSLTGITLAKGDGFRVSTGGEPFAGSVVKAEVGDVLVATVTSPSIVNVAHWFLAKRPQIRLLTRDEVDPNYRTVIEGASSGNSADITSLENKVAALFPLTPDVPILTAWADIYDPEQTVAAVDIRQGYSLLADWRDASNNYESAGVTRTPGVGVNRYSGLGLNQQRVFGFEVTGPSDLTLLSIVDGSEIIPFIDMTLGGNFRVNNFTPSHAQDEVVTNSPAFSSRTAGTGVLSVGGAVSTYDVPDYPANTTAQSRSVSIDFEVLVNGGDTGAGGDVNVDIPDTNVAQAQRTVDHVFNLGPLHGNRQIDATIGYEVRLVGPDIFIDLSLETAPSDVTLSVQGVAIIRNYTASIVIARVDDFQTLGDALGAYQFTGGQDLVVAFHPRPNDETLMDMVPVVRDATSGTIDELNDDRVHVPRPLYDVVEAPDTIEFRTFQPDHFFIHDDLASLLRQDRDTRWVYGLARENAITEHAVTEPIDLHADSTKDGESFSSITVVLQVATLGNLQQNVVLPSNYNTFDYVDAVEFVSGTPNEWRTVSIPIALLVNGDVGLSDLIRIQGNTDFTWTQNSRTLTSQAGATIYRATLVKN